MKKYSILLLAVLAIFFFPSCDDDDSSGGSAYFFEVDDYSQARVQEALILMQNGETLEFGAGTFSFTSTLSVEGKDDITIIGAGQGQTILDFTGQISGAEGLKITNCDMILMQGFSVQNTVGDAIKASDCNGITFYDVATIWTAQASEDNGAYGLYPVTSQNVLIDACRVIGASDAGIYVGQSRDIIVRNSSVENNVAGIEIENCLNSDVYGNICTKNTGGILIFDLPGLTIPNGSNCRVYNNTITENDYRNFAPAGNTVGYVPSGTGIMILGTDQVEIFNNTLTNNNVMGIGLVSYGTLESLASESHNDQDYDGYIGEIHIHDNTISRTTTYPTEQGPLGNILQGNFPDGDIPDIIFDGYADPAETAAPFCLNNPGGSFVNVNVPEFFENKSFDDSPYQCTLPALGETTVTAPSPR